DFESAQLGKHQVEEDQVRARVTGTGQRVGAVVRHRDHVPLFLEVEAQRIPDGRIVLHDKDAFGQAQLSSTIRPVCRKTTSSAMFVTRSAIRSRSFARKSKMAARCTVEGAFTMEPTSSSQIW